MHNKKKQTGTSVLIFIICSLLILISVVLGTCYFYLKTKYAGDAIAYSRQQIQNLEAGSLEEKLVHLFYSDEEIKAIQTKESYSVESGMNAEQMENNDVEIVPVHGITYEGYMMIVHNPDDLKVAVNPNMDSGAQAPSLERYVQDHKALAGLNAGGFQDAGGTGNGGLAWGMVIHDGKLISGSLDAYLPMIGINSEKKLVCQNTTARTALEWGIQEAVTFGPVLITDYQVVYKDGDGDYPMLNPRTAIGQRSDGAFLLLAIDGRGPTSFGALYPDTVKIFQSFDATAAANLDGGNSTAMIYDGEYVNTTVSMYGSRHLPTAFIVKGEE